MKKFLEFITICFIASILFSSCRSNLSVTKRLYNDGYYIASSKDKKVMATTKEKELLSKIKKPLYPETKQPKQSTSGVYSDSNDSADQNDMIASNEKMSSKTIAPYILKQVIKQKTKIAETPATHAKNIKSLTNIIGSDSSKTDGLSLFWIVILILLVLWALGLLGGIALGGLIHILLVIALVLLILWLLRII